MMEQGSRTKTDLEGEDTDDCSHKLKEDRRHRKGDLVIRKIGKSIVKPKAQLIFGRQLICFNKLLFHKMLLREKKFLELLKLNV